MTETSRISIPLDIGADSERKHSNILYWHWQKED
jgi:hypothetical protein